MAVVNNNVFTILIAILRFAIFRSMPIIASLNRYYIKQEYRRYLISIIKEDVKPAIGEGYVRVNGEVPFLTDLLFCLYEKRTSCSQSFVSNISCSSRKSGHSSGICGQCGVS